MEARCLSLHAAYACQHRGDCCRAWQVRAEPHVVDFVRRKRPFEDEGSLLVARPADNKRYLAHSGGVCVFRTRERCGIHLEEGEMALPVSCRHFPRVILRDRRGTLIALSHYCPTAAALLFDIVTPARAVPAGAPVLLREPVEGLDARDALPPMLHPGMLADIEGYEAWEASAIETLAAGRDLEAALRVIESATEDVRRWTPARGPLTQAVDAAFKGAQSRDADTCRRPLELEIVRGLYAGDMVLDAGPDFERLWDAAAPQDRLDLQRPIANYLAARLFGNWIAYQGQGLRSVVAWLRGCYDVLRAIATADRRASDGPLSTRELLEAIRHADLVMLHTVDSQAFAHRVAALEKAPAA